MKHTNRDNAAEMDRDHDADPYDLTLNAGICRRCGQPCRWPDELPAGATLEPWTDADTAELAAEFDRVDAEVRDAAQLARLGADRIRRMAQPEASTWIDCDRSNTPAHTEAGREAYGAEQSRRYRAERDARDDERSPYPPDRRPYPLLEIARVAIRARKDADR